MRALPTTRLITCLLLAATAIAFAGQPQTPPHAQPAPRPQQSRQAHAALAANPLPLPAQSSQQPTASAQPPSAPSSGVAEPAHYSADTLYNLANSYARAGKTGLAVLNYERAALLAPNDADIKANLDYVRAAAKVPTETPTRFVRFAEATNPTAAAWLGVIGLALLGTSLLASKATQRFRALWTMSALLGAVQIGLTISNALLLRPRMDEAVVLIDQTPARASPVPMGDTIFTLHEAETVTMSAQLEDFVLVRTRSGRTGWVARASVGAVIPQGNTLAGL